MHKYIINNLIPAPVSPQGPRILLPTDVKSIGPFTWSPVMVKVSDGLFRGCLLPGMFTDQEREALRTELTGFARNDARIVAAASLGSAARGELDRWSDVDLALRLAPLVLGSAPAPTAGPQRVKRRGAARAGGQSSV